MVKYFAINFSKFVGFAYICEYIEKLVANLIKKGDVMKNSKKYKRNSVNKFPVRLRSRMLELGIRASELARRLDVSQTAVSNWLGGNSRPRSQSLYDLAQILNVDEAYLLGKTDDAAKEVSSPINSEQGSETISDMVESLRKKIARVSGYEIDRVKLILEFD